MKWIPPLGLFRSAQSPVPASEPTRGFVLPALSSPKGARRRELVEGLSTCQITSSGAIRQNWLCFAPPERSEGGVLSSSKGNQPHRPNWVCFATPKRSAGVVLSLSKGALAPSQIGFVLRWRPTRVRVPCSQPATTCSHGVARRAKTGVPSELVPWVLVPGGRRRVSAASYPLVK